MEQGFTNDTIDTALLPKLEDVELTPLHPSYIKVIWFNVGMVYLIIGVLGGLALYFIEEVSGYLIPAVVLYVVLFAVTIVINLISFKNRGFAFRTHDVIYRTGAIGITTSIIPYTRIQHVAQHEGVISRFLGLATVGIFTAGALGSDIKIPGLEKIHATAIKKLLLGKIEGKTADEEVDLYSRATNVEAIDPDHDEANGY